MQGVRLSADRRTMSFPLSAAYVLRTFTQGSTVILDLVMPEQPAQPQIAAPTDITRPGGAPTAPTQPSPAAIAPASTTAADVRVRTGVHPDYFRVVFDFPSQVDYEVDSSAGRTDVRFARSANFDQAALRRSLPSNLRDIIIDSEAGGTTVSFPSGEAEVRHFRNNASVVVDFIQGSVTQTAAAQVPASTPSAAPAPSATAAAPTAVPDGDARPPQSVTANSTPAAPAQPAAPARQALDVDAIAQAGLGQFGGNENVEGQVTMSFAWSEPTAAAVFRRAGYLWVVFDRFQQLNLEALQRSASPYVKLIEQLPYRNNTIVRMITEPGFNPTLRREGLVWLMDLSERPMRPGRPMDVRPIFAEGSPKLFLPVTEGGRTVAIEDPEVGDFFLVVPVIPLGYGVSPERRFPDAVLPVTAQGAVIIPRHDDVRAIASRDGIDITASGGFKVSPQVAEGQVFLPDADPTTLSSVLNVQNWQINDGLDLRNNLQVLKQAATDPRESVRDEARLRLARYYFANGYFAEALGVLGWIVYNDPPSESRGQIRALRGAASLLMARYEDAETDLSHPSLAAEEDARFWLSAARAKTGAPGVQAQALIQLGGAVQNFPKEVRIPMALIIAEEAIESGDDFAAKGFLDLIREQDPSPSQAAAIEYLDGRLNEMVGELEIAIEQYQNVMDGSNFQYAILAERDKNDLEHEMGRISTQEYIDTLEKLRFRWRGDEIELGMLLRLGELYAADRDYGKALRTLKLATQYFRDYEGVDVVANRMTEMFEDLYLGGAADNLSPVTAIALFDEFRTLIPPGGRGDEMIRKLADRLVAVDLLDQAVVLLENQVEFRLEGVERARVAARLALVYLMNRQPEKAVEVLESTELSGAFTRELQSQRRFLMARALTDLGNPEDAIVLLGGDRSRDSRRLRAEIHWRSQNWVGAAGVLETLVPSDDQNRLSEAEARMVLDWVTALTLAGDDRSTSRVRVNYKGLMDRTQFAEAFDLITTPPERGIVDYRTVREQIEKAENFKSFLTEYEDLISETELSEVY